MVLNKSINLYSQAINNCEEFCNLCLIIFKEPKIINDALFQIRTNSEFF